MFFKRKEKVESNTDTSSDEKIVHGVNHREAFAALTETDPSFSKGCFDYKPPTFRGCDHVITINDTKVLVITKNQRANAYVDISHTLWYIGEGLDFKDEILTALKRLVREHKIFVENREKETLEGLKNSLNDYISD